MNETVEAEAKRVWSEAKMAIMDAHDAGPWEALQLVRQRDDLSPEVKDQIEQFYAQEMKPN